jgi:hypothetical protein
MNVRPHRNIYTPKCSNCKHSRIDVCIKFKYITIDIEKNKVFDYYLDTDICRSNPTLCGVNGLYFEKK